MAFNNMTNVTTFSNWIVHTDTITGGLYAHVIVLMVWVIAFVALGNRPREDAFAVASFISFIVATLMWVITDAALPVILTTVALVASALVLLRR